MCLVMRLVTFRQGEMNAHGVAPRSPRTQSAVPGPSAPIPPDKLSKNPGLIPRLRVRVHILTHPMCSELSDLAARWCHLQSLSHNPLLRDLDSTGGGAAWALGLLDVPPTGASEPLLHSGVSQGQCMCHSQLLADNT